MPGLLPETQTNQTNHMKLEKETTQHAIIYRSPKRSKKWCDANDLAKAAWKFYEVDLPYNAISRRIADLNSGRYGDLERPIEKKKMDGGTVLYRVK